MDHGQIVQLSSGAELYRNPVSCYVADFIGEANLIRCDAGPDGSMRLEASDEMLPFTVAASWSGHVDGAAGAYRDRQSAIGSRVPAQVSARVRDVQLYRAGLACIRGAGIRPGKSPCSCEHPASVERLRAGDDIMVWWPRECSRILTS